MDLQVGHHRGIALWGGYGARQLLRVQYPRTVIDNRTLDMPYTQAGAERVKAMGFNSVYLMCSWGFPPEEDEFDWENFRKAVGLYHAAGIQVCGGVQVSTYIRRGSYANREWDARDPWGEPIPFHAGRFFTCWHDPAWEAEVEQRIQTVIEAGADGVFFSMPWMGGVPFAVGRGLLGAAGCHCERCQAAYAEASGSQAIPKGINIHRTAAQMFLRWRAYTTAVTLDKWADYARELNPDVCVSTEGYAELTLNPLVLHGHELTGGATMHDIVLAQSILPRYGPGKRLYQNAVKLGVIVPDHDQTVVASYTGPQRMDMHTTATPAQYVAAVGEASAMQSPAVLNGTEYVAGRSLTLLLSDEFAAERHAIGRVNAWLAKHAGWLHARANSSPLAVYCPHEALMHDWRAVAPAFWGACHTLIQHRLPFRVVNEKDWQHAKTLIVPPGTVAGLNERLARFVDETGGRVIALKQARPGSAEQPLWKKYKPARLAWYHWPLVRRLTYRAGVVLWRWYHTHVLARVVLGWFQRRVAVPSGGGLPPVSMQTELVRAIGSDVRPSVEGEGPLLFTIWRDPGGGEQWHLVNYQDKPQRITIHTPQFVSGWVFSPDEDQAKRIFGNSLIVSVRSYKVLRVK